MSEKNPTPVENDKGESATVPPPESTSDPLSGEAPNVEVGAVSSRSRKDAVVKVALPFWCTSFTLPREGGDTLVIDRSGVEVAHADLEALLDAATQSGVTLNVEVSE